MIRWGVISTANIGRQQVIPAIQASANGQVVAVGSRSEQKGKQFAQELGIERSYGSYDALLADPDIDAIYNPLPNDGHAPWSIAALRAGKHVLCEKPLAMDAEEARQMIAVSQETGKLLMEAFMWRYHPQHARAKELLDSGVIGEPNLIECVFSYSMSPDTTENVRLEPAMGGGGLWDIGCYCVNTIRTLSGQEPESVSGYATLGERSQVDENFVGILRFKSGLLAHFDCGMRGYNRQSYTVVGPKGMLSVLKAFRPDTDPGVIEISRSAGSDQHFERLSLPPTNQYTLMVEDFADAILTNRKPRYAPEDGLRNMQVLDALLLSSREGRVIAL